MKATLWDFSVQAELRDDGQYRVVIVGNRTGERRESVGYHPLWELIRLLGMSAAIVATEVNG
jgi:hypothetical protein